jgi:hypothetical protein
MKEIREEQKEQFGYCRFLFSCMFEGGLNLRHITAHHENALKLLIEKQVLLVL